MRRIATVLAMVVAICLLRVPDVLAGGGFGPPPPDRTIGPTLRVSVVMEGPRQPPYESTPRQFAMSVERGHHPPAAIFTSGSNYAYGCLQPGFPDLQASTEQRFLGYMATWAPVEVLDALILPFGGDPDRAVIVAVYDISCTPIGDKEYLHFTGRVKVAR